MAINTLRSVDIDDEFRKATLHQIAAHMGVELPPKDSGELRIPCCFCEVGDESSYGALAINLDKPHNPFMAHCCGEQGNRFKLMYFWKHGELPPSGSVRGEAWNEMLELHQQCTGSNAAESPTPPEVQSKQHSMRSDTSDVLANIPLKESDRDNVRKLATLYQRLITDPQKMAPKAAQFVRSRPWMTPQLLQKFRVGWTPKETLFRKNYMIYAHEDEHGNVLSHSGRDLFFEEKQLKWKQAGHPEGKEPIKHKFVQGYHRGQQLYGRSSRRLKPAMKEALATYGLIIVEGMNDVMRLGCFPLGAEALCSNQATDKQLELMVEDARKLAGGRIWLLPDRDKGGLQGFQQLLWKLQQHERISARPGWARGLAGVHEPEELTDEQLVSELAPFLLSRETM